jgi:hypothetical protein
LYQTCLIFQTTSTRQVKLTNKSSCCKLAKQGLTSHLVCLSGTFVVLALRTAIADLLQNQLCAPANRYLLKIAGLSVFSALLKKRTGRENQTRDKLFGQESLTTGDPS